MIESCYWKEELKRIAKTIRPSNKPYRYSQRLLNVTERDLMIGFFMLRRLIEMHKVSSATKDYQMKVFACASKGKLSTLMNRHCIDELYELDKETPMQKKPFYIANQFIHSYSHYLTRDETRNWSDIFIVSDFDRNNCIWRIPVSVIHELFMIASYDYPHSTTMTYSSKTKNYEVKTN